MAEDPRAIRQDIEQTRRELSKTLDALQYKADVRGRLNDKVTQKWNAIFGLKDKLMTRTTSHSTTPNQGTHNQQGGPVAGMRDTAGSVMDSATTAMSSVQGTAAQTINAMQETAGNAASAVQDNGGQAVGMIQQNPLGLAIGAIALGFIAGYVLPSTKMESERIGPVADEVKHQVSTQIQATAQEAASQAVNTAQQAMQAATAAVEETVNDNRDQFVKNTSVRAQETLDAIREAAATRS